MTLVGLIRAGRKVKSEDYSPSVRKIIGKGPSIFIDLTIIIYIFGVFIQYEVIIYSLIGRTLFEFFADDKYDN
jgi:amino acid permease